MTTWVSQYQNVEPFWTLLQQGMMEEVMVITRTSEHLQIIRI